MGDEEKFCDELLLAETQTLNPFLNYIDSATQKCAVELGIPDIVHKHDKPMSLSDLIAALPIHTTKAPYVHRLVRVLVLSDVLSVSRPGRDENLDEDEEEYYMLTRAGRLLMKDEPLNLRDLHNTHYYEYVVKKSFYCLGDWFKNNDPTAFYTANKETFWDYISHDPRYNDVFNEIMAKDSLLVMKLLLSGESKNVFDGVTSLVDIGGGNGTVASAIAKCFPAMKCIVLDLPHVVGSVHETSIENLEFIAGNMFENIPTANVVLLKWILHDWEDEECVEILKKCKEAIPSREEGGKVIIIDMVIEDPKQDFESSKLQLSMDIVMMVLYGSKERNKKQWIKLFSETGFSDYKITLSLGLKSLIEVFP